jgi:PTH1 family peptidyl-tRNA hydrolase
MLLVVGLGNPGKEYAGNRHNIGFMALDRLADEARADAFREKFSGEYSKCELGSEPAILLKPMTYMNESGRSVQAAATFFKVAPKDVIVLHDELDLPFGDVKLKMGGGHAGHNGLRSIIACIGAEFARVRLGVGRPPAGFHDVASFVLANFDANERLVLPEQLKRALKSVLDSAARGFPAAMNRANASPPKPKPKDKPKAKADETASNESFATAASNALAATSARPPAGLATESTATESTARAPSSSLQGHASGALGHEEDT